MADFKKMIVAIPPSMPVTNLLGLLLVKNPKYCKPPSIASGIISKKAKK